MRRLAGLLALLGLVLPAAAGAQQVVMPPTGRYQLVVATGIAGSPFLVDTTTGCVWSAVQDPESKRTAFIEVEIQNLHWSLGSQAVLSQRIDGSTELSADQKRALKGELERTRCGQFSVLLAPDQGTARPGESKTPPPPTKAPAPTKR
jgi:hypothetical protein